MCTVFSCFLKGHNIMRKDEFKNWSNEDLMREVTRLRKRKKYGIVWEDKQEDVVEQCKHEFPVLCEVEKRKVISDLNKPVNLLIEGDNYHVLSVLNYTHKNRVDVIYIDPPYNTGAKSWRYNNNYVDKEDSFRHSKWISFMQHRLQLAKKLLTNKGFIICAIDANELFSLGLLMDEIFEEKNRIGLVTVLHNPKGRNFTNWFSANSEYMLVYSRNAKIASFNKVAIDEEKKMSFDLQDKDGRHYRLEPFIRSRSETLRERKPNFWYPIFVSKNLKKITLKPTKGFVKVYPIANDGKEVTWINLPETFDEKNSKGLFVAKRENEKIVIYRKYYEQQIFKNVWTDQKYQSEFHGTNLLKKILGKNVFEYPKSIYLLKDILKITTNKNSVILDFFAGSGTTGHAVMELNNEDGGSRKFILATNNENNIATNVCFPRIKKLIRGYKSGGERVNGLNANLRYFRTSFVPAESTDKNKRELTLKATEMICIREETFEKVIARKAYQIYKSKNHHTGIIFDQLSIDKFKEFITKIDSQFNVYIFSLCDDTFDDEFADMKHKVTISPIPEAILRIYRRIFK